MAHTHSKILLHVVFSTSGRRQLITPELRLNLWPYMGGIVRSLKATSLIINGVADHAHLLLSVPPKLAVAELVGKVKANSSKWVNEDTRWGRFAWQQGYSVFSVSHSQEDVVRAYIERQEEHHRKLSFSDELLAMLEKHKVEFDPRFVME